MLVYRILRFYMKNKHIILVVAFFITLTPIIVFGDEVTLENPLTGVDSITDLIERIINFITLVALAIAPIIFILAGLKFYFAGGDPQKAKEAAAVIKWAVIGLVIILLANGIIHVITDVIGADIDP